MLFLLILTLPACAASKLRPPVHQPTSGLKLLKTLQFPTNALNEYVAHRITRAALIKRLADSKVIVLGSTPDIKSRLFNIQNYILRGHSYTPLFSDGPTATHLLAGARAKPGMKLWEISSKALLGIFQHNEWIIINAGAPGMVEFHAQEFRPYLHNK